MKGNCSKELKFVGGLRGHLLLDSRNLEQVSTGKFLSINFKQGYRVYGTRGIASAITSSGSGLGGASGLYLVKRKRNKNNVEKESVTK